MWTLVVKLTTAAKLESHLHTRLHWNNISKYIYTGDYSAKSVEKYIIGQNRFKSIYWQNILKLNIWQSEICIKLQNQLKNIYRTAGKTRNLTNAAKFELLAQLRTSSNLHLCSANCQEISYIWIKFAIFFEFNLASFFISYCSCTPLSLPIYMHVFTGIYSLYTCGVNCWDKSLI